MCSRRIFPAFSALLLILLFLLLPSPILASDDLRFINLNTGYTGVFNDDERDTARYGAEYRHSPLTRWLLRPAIGGIITERDASYYYIGLRRDFSLASRWFLTPSFDIGSYRQGRGIDLGADVEFRSGLELSYGFRSAWRASLAFFHMSNSSLGDRNPGTDSVVVALYIPIGN